MSSSITAAYRRHLPPGELAVTWTEPVHSKQKVDNAGKFLAHGNGNGPEKDEALDILSNWRASHSFPLNTFRSRLQRCARRIYKSAIVFQRIKRVPSIVNKLRRFPTTRMSQMQDIGGCRAVVKTERSVRRLMRDYVPNRLKHELIKVTDYIDGPRDSGYRGIHLIYRYHGRKEAYDGLQIELQLRSLIQHAWATAVETVGTFLEHSLKSSEGPEQWLNFFKLASTAFASMEGTSHVPGTPSDLREVRAALSHAAVNLDVAMTLSAYRAVISFVEQEPGKRAHYYLLLLDSAKGKLAVRQYPKHKLPLATDDYLEMEKRIADVPGAQAVLVAAESITALPRGYPNYYLNTDRFLGYLRGFGGISGID